MSYVPFCPRRGHGVSAARRRQCTRHAMANIPRPGRAYLASSGAAGGGESGPPRAGDIRHDMAWECRRPAAGAKGEKGTAWFPFPLLTPPNLPLRRDALRLRGETGVTGARFRASGRFWDAVRP